MVIKAHDKVHYAWAVYEYVREYITSIPDLASFIHTNDKHKTFAEAGFPVAALPCGRRMLVGKNEVLQFTDHDFSNLSSVPTIILIY